MLVKELMTENVETIDKTRTLRDAAQRMAALDIGMLPVASDGKLTGVITDRDIAVRAVAQGVNAEEAQVGDFITPQLLNCSAEDDAELACQRMKEKQVRRLIVTDNDQKVAGVLSLGDIAVNRNTSQQAAEVLQQVSEPASSTAA